MELADEPFRVCADCAHCVQWAAVPGCPCCRRKHEQAQAPAPRKPAAPRKPGPRKLRRDGTRKYYPDNRKGRDRGAYEHDYQVAHRATRTRQASAARRARKAALQEAR